MVPNEKDSGMSAAEADVALDGALGIGLDEGLDEAGRDEGLDEAGRERGAGVGMIVGDELEMTGDPDAFNRLMAGAVDGVDNESDGLG